MKLQKIQTYLEQKGWKYKYYENDGLGSVNFEARGLKYYVWEFYEGEYGAESNVRTTSRSEDYFGDYEEEILNILRTWH